MLILGITGDVTQSDFTETVTLIAADHAAGYTNIRFSADWDATGNFQISCTGEVLIYGLKLLDDILSNSFIHLQTQIDQTIQSITLLASMDYVSNVTQQIYESFNAQLQITAQQISSVVQQINALTGEEIVSRINQTAEAITIDAQHINLVGDITANGNVHIKNDGTIVAKGGTFNGFIQMPFKKLSESDATPVNGSYKIAQEVNIIDDIGATIVLPDDDAYNGIIISILGMAGPVITYSDLITVVQTESGNPIKNSGATGANTISDNSYFNYNDHLRVWGIAQFLGTTDGQDNMQWYYLGAYYKSASQ
jgi:hypothetical protein